MHQGRDLCGTAVHEGGMFASSPVADPVAVAKCIVFGVMMQPPPIRSNDLMERPDVFPAKRRDLEDDSRLVARVAGVVGWLGCYDDLSERSACALLVDAVTLPDALQSSAGDLSYGTATHSRDH